MKAYELLKRWQQLPPNRQDSAIQFLTGALDCVATGFTTPHRDAAHAKWAIEELEEAVEYAETKK